MKNGSPERTRTADPVVNSHMLYRLSYRGTIVAIFIVLKALKGQGFLGENIRYFDKLGNRGHHGRNIIGFRY